MTTLRKPEATTSSLMAPSLGIVLTGGRSSRMGRDKARLPYRGRRLVDHMLDLVAQSGVGSIVVSGVIDGLFCIEDKVTNRGPIGGLYSVVCAERLLEKTTILVVPVDMPNLSPSVLRLLLTQLDIDDTKKHAAHFEQYEMPAAFVVNADLKRHLEEIITATDPRECSVRALLTRIGAVSVAIDDNCTTAFQNLNSPHQWFAFEKEIQQ